MPMKLLKLKFKCIPGSYKTAAGQVSLHHLLGKTFTLKERNFTHCIDQSLFYRLKAYVFQSYICPGVSFLDTVVLSYPWGTCSKIPSGCLKMCIVLNPTQTTFFNPYTYITMIKLNLQIRDSQRLTITNNKVEQLHCNKSYVNVVSLSIRIAYCTVFTLLVMKKTSLVR